MANNWKKTQLLQPNPWDEVACAREQRGVIVAGWCMALLARLRMSRSRIGMRSRTSGPVTSPQRGSIRLVTLSRPLSTKLVAPA